MKTKKRKTTKALVEMMIEQGLNNKEITAKLKHRSTSYAHVAVIRSQYRARLAEETQKVIKDALQFAPKQPEVPEVPEVPRPGQLSHWEPVVFTPQPPQKTGFFESIKRFFQFA
jgi:hypothetical protein